MRPRDTDEATQRLLDEHHRRMTPAQKGQAVRDAWNLARRMQLAGLRAQFPSETEEELAERLYERWLGAELYARVRSVRKDAPHT